MKTTTIFLRDTSLIVGLQATQKCSFEYIIKKMDFFFRTFLYGV